MRKGQPVTLAVPETPERAISLSRRGFLIGMSAVGTATALRPTISLLPNPPVLWADGIHDDTEALQALFDGKEIIHGSSVLARSDGGRVVLRDAALRLCESVEVGRYGHTTLIDSCAFLCEGGGTLNFDDRAGGYSVVTNCYFDSMKMNLA